MHRTIGMQIQIVATMQLFSIHHADSADSPLDHLSVVASLVDSSCHVNAVNMTSGSIDEAGNFSLNPHARIFRPGEFNPAIDDADMYDIYCSWYDAAFAWEDETPSARFLTWRVAPSVGKRYCLNSREVLLYDNPADWRARIQQAWADEHDFRSPTQLYLVSPSPDAIEPGFAGHIILQQHPMELRSPVMITVDDPALGRTDSVRQVHVLADRSLPEDVVFFAGYSLDCPHIAWCRIFLRYIEMPAGRPFALRPGDALELTVQRHFVPANWLPPTLPRILINGERG